MTREEAEILKKRALEFLDNAKGLLKKGVFDLAAFNIEQFCQLYLKYKLLANLGDFPKTHSLRALLAELGNEKVKEFAEDHAFELISL